MCLSAGASFRQRCSALCQCSNMSCILQLWSLFGWELAYWPLYKCKPGDQEGPWKRQTLSTIVSLELWKACFISLCHPVDRAA